MNTIPEYNTEQAHKEIEELMFNLRPVKKEAY